MKKRLFQGALLALLYLVSTGGACYKAALEVVGNVAGMVERTGSAMQPNGEVKTNFSPDSVPVSDGVFCVMTSGDEAVRYRFNASAVAGIMHVEDNPCGLNPNHTYTGTYIPDSEKDVIYLIKVKLKVEGD